LEEISEKSVLLSRNKRRSSTITIHYGKDVKEYQSKERWPIFSIGLRTEQFLSVLIKRGRRSETTSTNLGFYLI